MVRPEVSPPFENRTEYKYVGYPITDDTVDY